MDTAAAALKIKASGAYYTERSVADFLVRWALREPFEKVMDPSFGGGVFLDSCLARLDSLGNKGGRGLFGIELDNRAFDATTARLAADGNPAANLRHGDFLDVAPADVPSLDAVVGNPPFVRYQRLSHAAREKGLARARQQGVELSRLASSWAPFLVHSVSFLSPGGRLAMVLPAELVHAVYARPVLEHLKRTFGYLTVIRFRRPPFPALCQDTLLLLADVKGGTTSGIAWREVEDAAGLHGAAPVPQQVPGLAGAAPRPAFGTGADGGLGVGRAIAAGDSHDLVDRPAVRLLGRRALELYTELCSTPGTFRLGEAVRLRIGYVSGNNRFFHPDRVTVRQWRLPRSSLARSVFRGRAFVGLGFDQRDWRGAVRHGSAGYLLHVAKGRRFGAAVRAYIEDGERSGAHLGYKTRERTPWYGVPNVLVPDAFLTSMSSGAPVLVANESGAAAPNTLHLLTHLDQQMDPRKLAAAWRSSLSTLSAELEGHSLGGGMLKLEPSEARRVLVAQGGAELEVNLEEVDMLLRSGGTAAATRLVDRLVLQQGLGLSTADCELLVTAVQRLREWRASRRPAAKAARRRTRT